jgi:hypothetical protein
MTTDRTGYLHDDEPEQPIAPITVAAPDIRPLDRLYVAPAGAEPWCGPTITRVELRATSVTIHTWNGGQQTYTNTERVQVIR